MSKKLIWNVYNFIYMRKKIDIEKKILHTRED